MEHVLMILAGMFTGVLAGFLGIGGGTVLVPILVKFGTAADQAVATSSLAIVVTSIAGSIQNWRMGYLKLDKILLLGLPAIVTAQFGVALADNAPAHILLAAFAVLLLVNIFLVGLKKSLVARSAAKAAVAAEGSPGAIDPNATPAPVPLPMNPTVSRLFTGGAAGFLAGLFGIGGGVIMVPMQMLLLGETIKTAVQTSLGVIVITAISAVAGHALKGNVLFLPGLLLGIGGLIGVQFSTRFLPKMPDRWVSLAFRTLLLILSGYVFYQAWLAYQTTSPAIG